MCYPRFLDWWSPLSGKVWQEKTTLMYQTSWYVIRIYKTIPLEYLDSLAFDDFPGKCLISVLKSQIKNLTFFEIMF